MRSFKQSLNYLRRLCVLVWGLFLCSCGTVLTYRSDMGLGPWDVFHKGLSLHLPLSFGQAAIIVGAVIIMLGLFLKVKPGVGTVLNMLLIGFFADWQLNSHWLPDLGAAPLPLRLLVDCAGVFAMGLGTAFYILPSMGAGPRDGLMLRLNVLTKQRVAVVRAAIELSALTIGFLLGGTVGIGTLIFAFGVGPAVEVGFWLTKRYLYWLVPQRAKAPAPVLYEEEPVPVPL
jgi:uncharacterized membrane protein YczE